MLLFKLNKKWLEKVVYYLLIFSFIFAQLYDWSALDQSFKKYLAPQKAMAAYQTSYSITTASSSPYDLVYYSSYIYFTENNANKIGRLNTVTGSINEYSIPTANSGPRGITVDGSGNIWFAENAANKIGKLTPSTSEFTEYSIDTTNSQPEDVAYLSSICNDAECLSPYTAIVFTETNGNKIGKLLTADGIITEYTIATANSQPKNLSIPSDITDYATFIEYAINKTGSFDAYASTLFEGSTRSYSITDIVETTLAQATPRQSFASSSANNKIYKTSSIYYDLPGSGVEGLTIDSSGGLWWAEYLSGKIGYSATRDTSDVVQYTISDSGTTPFRVASSATGVVYYTDPGANKIGKVSSVGDFSIAATPSSRSVNQGSSTTFTVSTTASGGDTETIALSASGLPSGVSSGFSPSSVTAGSSSTLTLTVSDSATTGTATVTITGTGTSNTHSTTVSLTVNQAPDFSISASPSSRSIEQGQSTTFTITLTGSNGYSEAVALSTSGLPSGVSSGFSSSPVTPDGTSTLTLTSTSSATVGSHTITITGTGTSKTHSTTVTLAISSASEADFTNIITPETQTIIQGNSATLNVTLTASNGFSSEVTLEVSGLPTGVTSSFDDNTITPTNTANLTLTVSDSATAGNYTITVTGTGGGKTHADTTVLTISNAPDFTMELSPSSKTVVQGSSISYQLSVTSLYGFNSAISLSLAGLPTGASASYNDSTRYVTINTLTTTPIGSYTLLLTGTSAGKTHSATGYMNVNTLLPNFSANPSSGWEGRSITIGASGYPSSTTLYLKWDGSQIASYTTGDDGTISSTFTVPAGATRTRHYLTLTNSDGSYSVSNVAFDVVGYWQQYTPSHYNKSISTSSKEGSYCEENTLIISGTGFPENAPLVLYENDVYKLSFTSNSYGNFSQKITIGKTENKDNAKTYSYKVKTDDNWLTSGSKKFTQLTSSSSRKAYPIVDSGTPSMQVSLQGSLKSNSLSVKWDSIDGLRAVNANLGLSGGTTDIGVSDLQVDCIGNISKGYITIPGSGRAPAGKHALTFSDGIDTWYQSFYVFYSSYGWNAMESSEQVGFLDQLALKWYGKKFATLDDLQRSQIESMARGFNNGVYDTRYLESLNSYGTVEDVNIEITLAGQSCSDDSFSANYLSIHKALASGTSPCVVALNDTNSTTYELPNPTYGGYTAIYVDTQGIPGVIQAQQHPKNKEVTYAITLPNNAMIFLQNEYVDSAGQKHQTTVSLYTAKGVLYVVDTWGDFNKMTMINTILTALQNGKKVSSSEVNEFLKQQKKQNKWGAVGYEEDSVEVAFEDVCKNNPYLCKYTDDGSGTGNVWIIGSATAQITTNGEGLETAQVTTAGGGLGNNDPSIINKALAEGNSASYLTNYINITANKTVALMITDPLGRHIGWDPVTDVGLNELSNAIASHAKDSIDGESRDSFYILNNIIKGKYILRAYALEDGEYNINVNIPIIDKVVRKTFTGTAKAGDIIDGNIEVDWDALTPTQLKTRKILSTGGIVFGSILGLFVLGWALWHWRKYHNFKLRLK